jgi:hypothetical protein
MVQKYFAAFKSTVMGGEQLLQWEACLPPRPNVCPTTVQYRYHSSLALPLHQSEMSLPGQARLDFVSSVLSLFQVHIREWITALVNTSLKQTTQ